MQKDDEQRIKDELQRMPYEPLLPVERKLILGSLILETVLLVCCCGRRAADRLRARGAPAP
ncbi:MAG: hypothetical protein R3F45_13355 [Gammaproteobacteria bacterium]